MMDAQLEDALVDAIVEVLFRAAGEGASNVHLEWSQAGPQHSGRAYAVRDGQAYWFDVPTELASTLRQLRARQADPHRGAWLSVRIMAARGGQPRVEPNLDERPYWNAWGTSMLEAPAVPPVPDERRWLADLQRYPRDREHLPGWLSPVEVSGEASAQLRVGLDAMGVPGGAVVLPGEGQEGEPFEGALEVVRYGPRHYGLRVRDYGQHTLIGEYFTERAACDALWQHLNEPLPPAVAVPRAALLSRVQAAAESLAALSARVRAAGPGGIFTHLASGLPYDRIGGLDGLYFWVWDTPWPMRSLPDSANGLGAQQEVFIATREVEVQAEIAPEWFGQPGGGLRFRVEQPDRSVRDLVRSGVLQRVQVM